MLVKTKHPLPPGTALIATLDARAAGLRWWVEQIGSDWDDSSSHRVEMALTDSGEDEEKLQSLVDSLDEIGRVGLLMVEAEAE
jgi:hypothetical protein